MTKASDRYARWFGTRVPLVSRGVIVLITSLSALPFSVIIYVLLVYGFTTTNLLIALLLSMLVGALFHIAYLLFLKVRFNNPSQNSEFHDLIGRIHQKVVVPPRTQVWVRKSEDVFIASTYNPVFDAVIVSEPMVELILKSPESGEALLAFHLFRVPQSRWFADLIGSVVLFAIFTFASSFILVPLAISIGQAILWGSVYVISALGSLSSFFMVPIILVILVKGTFWRHEPAFVAVQQIYGIHPNVAKVQVESSRVLNEEEAQTVIWGVRDWEKRKRSSRRLGVCTLVAIASFILEYAIIIWVGYVPIYPYVLLISYIPFILAGAPALIAFLLLRKWDLNAMSEVFQKTTDYDEPIWLD